jgi:hypothetical protein
VNTFQSNIEIAQKTEELEIIMDQQVSKLDIYNDLAFNERSSLEQTTLQHNIHGVAIKYSIIQNFSISLGDVLRSYCKSVIIDAEDQRLDLLIQEKIITGEILEHDLSRLLITVQAKRNDAKDQLQNLHRLGIPVVLVPGNNKYLSYSEQKKDVIPLLSKYMIKFNNIRLLGIHAKLRDPLEKELGIRLNNAKIFELQGYQSISNSSIWVYFVGSKLSDAAKSYLSRRRSSVPSNNFLVRNTDQLIDLCTQHSVYIHIDIKEKNDFLKSLSTLCPMTCSLKVNIS